ncbi:Pterin-4a-carbinolamine dehydratase [Nitrosospira sp. Nl5]|uniref:4a-hydroxytetrahydrobiopterin dehydratase n=1 Tax=Nitrosospira sp. Nl5 TaxID=200120 RepID=UPI00088F376A|nr:4a-hydroxytetrahydrobiopterin dehydratase [Nitrosospira sp. Nl5]SCY62037.1 Pterin-4a-carbinolamine dehydratase [Nitrosospira sp. Nl5]
MQPFTFFISYRRQDTAPIALLLKNEIEKRIQFVRVSVDVGEIRGGEHFPDRLRALIGEAHATIALIGKNWLPRRENNTVPRGDDWVIAELEQSASLPILHNGDDRYGRSNRFILPLFVDCERRFDQFEIPEAIGYLAGLQAEHIDYASWPTEIGPLIDRIAVSLGLKKRPDSDEYPKPSFGKARTQPVGDVELTSILSYEDYEGWYVDNFGYAEVRYIVKTFKFPQFNDAADFMALVANHCRVLDHHPEWRNVFNHVTVSLTTWDARRRVTIYDLNLALYMNKAANYISKA